LGRRLQSRAAEAPADASFQLTISLAALMWLVLWVLFARSQRWKRFGRLLSAAPFALFCLAAWRSAAISCSAF
jgi:Gpi18-like mannosyltransferase